MNFTHLNQITETDREIIKNEFYKKTNKKVSF